VSVDEHMTVLAGSPVFYRSAPAPGDPVLYLHGIPTSSEDWIPFLERRGGIAPDLIGFGRSGKGGHLDYSIEGHAQFVEQLLDELGVQRVKLVVHDWGAAGGLTFAQQSPERITRLVVLNSVPLLEGFRWPGIARLLRRRGLGELAMGATNRWLLARTLRQGGPWPEARLESIWEQWDQGTQRAILRLYRSADEPRLAAAGRDLGRLQVPALILWGERDPWLSAQWGEGYAASLSQAALQRLPGAGHWPWLDDEAVIDRVSEFLL
jgi:pimeloyl-ACP methyl ester carboxylesterase